MTRPAHARTREARTCGCGASLQRKRSDAQYFSTACRTRAHRLRVAESALRARKALQNRYTASADAFWTGVGQIRRGDLRRRWAREPLPTERQRAALDQREVRT